jgi:hypothetical protein
MSFLGSIIIANLGRGIRGAAALLLFGNLEQQGVHLPEPPPLFGAQVCIRH